VQVDIGALMGDMASLLGQLCGRAIRVDLVAGVGPYPCLLDAAQFRSALLNLTINARDAMPKGGVLTITIDDVSLNALQATGAQLIAGRYVRIRVEDTGHGIAADALSHVFEPFFTTKPAWTGTGLGLSQVYGFAQQSGGSVMIAGTSEEGTAVLLLLPHAGTQ
jgi:signal transduction histidine kinase